MQFNDDSDDNGSDDEEYSHQNHFGQQSINYMSLQVPSNSIDQLHQLQISNIYPSNHSNIISNYNIYPSNHSNIISNSSTTSSLKSDKYKRVKITSLQLYKYYSNLKEFSSRRFLCICIFKYFFPSHNCNVIMTTEQHSNHFGKDYLIRETSHCAKSLYQLIQKYPRDPNLQKRYFRLDCKKLIKSGQVSEAQMDDVLHSYFLNDEVAVIHKSLVIISKCEKELNKETVKYLRELSANEFSTVYSQIENNNTIISLDDNGPLSKRNKNDSLDNESWEYLDLMSFGGVELQLDNNSSPWITFTHLWEFNNENELKDFLIT